MSDDNAVLRAVLPRVSRYIGAAFGAATSAQIGDPVAGAFIGEVMAQAGEDFANRALSMRQEQRVASVLDMAAAEIARQLEAGRTLRSDGLFDESSEDAVEITEGVLLAARDEHQEKKLKYMANLFASIAFNEEITVNAATVALRDAEAMTWLDVCLMSIVRRPKEFPLPETPVNGAGTRWGNWAVSQSLVNMTERGLLYSPKGEPTSLGLPQIDLRMCSLKLQNRGLLVAGLMGLDTVPAEELAEPYELLLETARHHDEKQRLDIPDD